MDESYWALHFEEQEHPRHRYRPRVRVYGPGFDPVRLQQECDRMNNQGHAGTSPNSCRARNAWLDEVDKNEAIRLFTIERSQS